jgi:hypothetical protein
MKLFATLAFGNFSEAFFGAGRWSNWSECQVEGQCGVGTQSRTKTCMFMCPETLESEDRICERVKQKYKKK